MTDIDTLPIRLAKIERFLDGNARGWRDESTWRTGGPLQTSTTAGDGGAAMVLNADQTKADRAALGLDKAPVEPSSATASSGFDINGSPLRPIGTTADAGKPADDRLPHVTDARRSAALAGLEEFHGSDAIPPLTGNESTEQLEGHLAVARARKADLARQAGTGSGNA